ncbi:MAG: hypothetical protein ACKVOQ_13665 [Cyclobacteriaceae bacterium]
MKRSLFVFALIISAGYGIAQDIRATKLIWTVTGLSDLNTNKVSVYNCVFETNGAQAIVWKQKNGAYATTFIVTQMVGTWASVQANGQMVYSIALDGETGTLTFMRDATGAFITVDLSQPSGSRLKHRYSIGQVNTF